jgi:hypothetical protein
MAMIFSNATDFLRASLLYQSQLQSHGRAMRPDDPFTSTVTLLAAYDQAVTTTKTITIEVKGDSKKEANETFYLDLFGLSSNALLGNFDPSVFGDPNTTY